MDFKDLINERYSVRSFDTSREVTSDQIDIILRSALAAPTAVNFQPFHIWVMTEAKDIAKICESNKFPFVKDAKVLFVIGSDRRRSWKRRYDSKDFSDIDAAIVSTHMMLQIADLGLGTTWIGSFDPEVVRAYFPQMRDYELDCILPVGYPAPDCTPSDKHSASRSFDELVTVL
ncbi:MAG: nitroreductase family protein [Clostridiales bacterium]|nr:nitroreductase family protein [Clostridiales bacterium]